jgi:hypothetical protein
MAKKTRLKPPRDKDMGEHEFDIIGADGTEMPIWRDFGLPVQKPNRLKETARAAKKPSPKALAKGIAPVKKIKK